MAPTNISPATADTITAGVPVTEDTLTAGAATTVWHKAVATVTEYGVWSFGDLATYLPSVFVYDGLANANSSTPIPNYGTPVPNGPVQFPATVGHTYYFESRRNGAVTPATLVISVDEAADSQAPAGSLAVNDVTDGYPLVLMAEATLTPLKFIHPFPSGEAGVILPSGILAVEDSTADTINLYTTAYDLIAAVDTSALSGVHLSSNNLDTFYLGDNGGAGDATVRTITTAGVLSAVRWTLTGSAQVTILAANPANTILYYLDSSAANQPIKRWDLVGDVALADLVAGIANYAITHEILVLADGTLIVRYVKTSVVKDQKIIHYSAAGAVIATYVYGSDFGTNDDRIFTAIDDPVSFWFWVRPLTTAAAGTSAFKRITVSTMTVSITRTGHMFDNGITDESPITTSTPTRFGFSESCPAWQTRAGSPTTTETFTIRRQRRWLLPSSDSDNQMQIPTMQLLLRTGIGLLPDAAGSSTPLGVDPEVRLRISKDGGKTWGPERARSAGLRGEFKDRVTWTRATGNYRNAVGEVTVDAPVDWQWLAMLAKRGITEGSS